MNPFLKSHSSLNWINVKIFAFLILIILPFILIYSRARFFSPVSFDEEFYLWHGWMILKGLVPYRDFFEPKPPVIFFANGIGLGLFGLKDNLFRYVPGLLAALSVLTLYFGFIRNKINPLLATLLTLQFAYWLLGPEFHDSGLNDVETYALAFCGLGLGLNLWGSHAHAEKKMAIHSVAGFCYGLSVLSKELFLFSVLPACILTAYETQPVTSVGPWRKKQLLYTAAGGATIGLTFLFYLIGTQSLFAYFKVLNFSFNFAANYCIDLGVFPRLGLFGTLIESLGRLHGTFYNLSHFQLILPLVLLGLWTHRRSRLIYLFTISLFMGGYAVGTGHCFWKHYYLMGMIGALIPALFGARALDTILKQLKPTAAKIVYLTLILLILDEMQLTTHRVLKQNFNLTPPVSQINPSLVEIVKTYSQPEDLILTLGPPGIYYTSDRMGPLNILFLDEVIDYLLPGRTDEERFLNSNTRLELKPPKVLHSPLTWRHRTQRAFDHLFLPFLLKNHYFKINEETWILIQN